MNEILHKVINSLTSNQLEDIYIINKLKIQGFRVKGPSNAIKTQRMKTLLINNPKLDLVLKKTAEVYNSERNRDHTWALVEKIDLDLVKKKIEESDLSEVAYALIEAEKLEILKDILVPQTNENVINKEGNDMLDNKNFQSNGLEETVINLRGIVANLEEKNNELNKNLNEIRKEFTSLTHENSILKIKSNEQKDELVRFKDKNNQTKFTLDLTQEKIKKLENDLLKLELEKKTTILELEKVNKKNILFFGTNVYKRFINTKVSTLKGLNCEYIINTNGMRDFLSFQKLIVLEFTLTKSQLEDLLKEDFYNYFKNLHDLTIIESFEELNEYIERIGNYYE